MEVKPLVDNRYIPLIDTYYNHNSRLPEPSPTSLLSTTPEEIQRNLAAWRDNSARLHIIV